MTLAVTNFARNLMVLAIVVVVHLVLLYALSQIRSEKIGQPEEFRGTWITIEPRGSENKRSSARATQRLRVARPAASDFHEIRAAEPQLASGSDAIEIDWRVQGTQVAVDVAERYANKKAGSSFSPKPQAIEQRPSAIVPDSVFFAPVRKQGDTDYFDDGEIITWVSDQCYATNRPFAGPQLDENRLNVVCKDPFKARTVLFDDLKPKYLRGSSPDSDRAAEGVSEGATAPPCSHSTFRCK